ncbi:MAG: response regulator, partial [Planctomycetota bacterium]
MNEQTPARFRRNTEVRLVEAIACVRRAGQTKESRGRLASVLIVDDERENCQALGEILGELGFDTRSVQDGAAALEHVAHRTPDAILLDIGMPGLDGFEVLSRLRDVHPPTRLPIIM